MNAGIDYGMGQTNIDRKTGIRYGVVPQNDVLQAWADSSEPYMGNACPFCGNEPKSGNDITSMARCPSCHHSLNDGDFDDREPISFVYDADGYMAECGDDGDIFITKSPYYTLCSFCSPCAPGAGYVRNYNPEGVKAYCFGPDWYDDDDKPTFPIYKVSDNSIV
jgi:hypothetical protein